MINTAQKTARKGGCSVTGSRSENVTPFRRRLTLKYVLKFDRSLRNRIPPSFLGSVNSPAPFARLLKPDTGYFLGLVSPYTPRSTQVLYVLASKYEISGIHSLVSVFASPC